MSILTIFVVIPVLMLLGLWLFRLFWLWLFWLWLFRLWLSCLCFRLYRLYDSQ